MSAARFAASILTVIVAAFALSRVFTNPFYYFAGYVVLQYVVIATGWNILGGYAGYTNFGAAGFFGAGAYAAALLIKAYAAPIYIQLIAAGALGAALGLATGYLTLRVQGVYFAIATIALVVMLETIVYNIDYLGGAAGLPLSLSRPPSWFHGQQQFAFFVMLFLAGGAIFTARTIERSWFGRGLRAIRASEPAAECSGVPTLKLKLAACAISGAIIAMAGAPYATYTSYVDPVSAFSLTIGLNALAMPLIGGANRWFGPVIGAVLLSGAQQAATVTISSEFNILIVGVLLVGFVALAPDGLTGLFAARKAAS